MISDQTWFVVDEFPEVVVWDDNPSVLGCQAEDVEVVVAHDPLAQDLTGRRETKQVIPLKVGQQMLVWKKKQGKKFAKRLLSDVVNALACAFFASRAKWLPEKRKATVLFC